MRRRNLDLSWESLCVSFSGEFLVAAEAYLFIIMYKLLDRKWFRDRL